MHITPLGVRGIVLCPNSTHNRKGFGDTSPNPWAYYYSRIESIEWNIVCKVVLITMIQ